MNSIAPIPGWPSEVVKIETRSKTDGSMQPSLAFFAPKGGRRPLLVALHTWSFGFQQGDGETLYAKWCVENGWHFIHPHFRGANDKPEALGSELAVADIEDAVVRMKAEAEVDEERVYLAGVSGGGHMALLMAGRRPDLWAGVSAWCGIYDVREWHSQCKRRKPPFAYFKHIEQACGGDPETKQEAAWECLERSPAACLAKAKNVNLDINAGVRDGRDGSVPFSHSLRAFNAVAKPEDAIDEAEIEAMYESLKLPPSEPLDDPLYGRRKPLFRKTSGNARATIFDGGHDIVRRAALNWLAKQRRGVPAKWSVEKPLPLPDDDDLCAAGK